MLALLDFDRSAIEQAIKAAELRSTGEIMVVVERRRCSDVMARAKEVFDRRGLAGTRERNGILLYVQLKERDFVVLADEGIHGMVESEFWQNLCDRVLACFRRKEMTVGVLLGIMVAGDALARFYPCDGTPRENQLPNCAVGEE